MHHKNEAMRAHRTHAELENAICAVAVAAAVVADGIDDDDDGPPFALKLQARLMKQPLT